MAENDTLLAHLVPALTPQVEPAATRALAYILNNSPASRQALADLAGVGQTEISRVQAEFTAEDRSRADVVCFDQCNGKRVIIEAKFWEGLQEQQASGYLNQLSNSGAAVLMFIAPNVRLETLWPKIVKQVTDGGFSVGTESWSNRVVSVAVEHTNWTLMLTSWSNLLRRMENSDESDSIRADIRQLNGLAERQDGEAFLPIHEEDLGPDFARRMRGYVRLVDAAIEANGVKDGWMSTSGLRVTPQVHGYGRYFRFRDVPGDFWFGLNHNLWATRGDTPLWLYVPPSFEYKMIQIGNQLKVQPHNRTVPIYLKTGVEYEDVLGDVVEKLKEIGKLVGGANIA